MRKVKIALYQCALKSALPQSVIYSLSRIKPDFLVLPEYFFFEPLLNIEKNPQAYSSSSSEAKLKAISEKLPQTVIIGGSMITQEKGLFYNSCLIYYQGKEMGRYHKQRLFEREVGKITPHDKTLVFQIKGITIGVLICADVFENRFFEEFNKLKTHCIFIPTFSPYKKEARDEKIKRDEAIFLNGAKLSNSFIVKTCGISRPKDIYSIQGRSLIASPERILWRTPFWLENKEILKIAQLQIS